MSGFGRLIAAVAGLFLAGCLDFEDITAPPAEVLEPTLRFSLRSVEGVVSSEDLALFTGGLHLPGHRDSDSGALGDPVLTVGGVPFLPTDVQRTTQGELVFVYQGEFRPPLDPLPPARLSLIPPRLLSLGLTGEPAELFLPIPRRDPAKGDTIQLGPGEDLRLPVRDGVPSAELERVSEWWSFTVDDTIPPVDIDVISTLPSPVVVPASFLPQKPAFPVELRVQRTLVAEPVAERYAVEVNLAATIEWWVERVGSSDPP